MLADPYKHDPGRWGDTMGQFAELMLPCLDATGARTVYEVGALAGGLTETLLAWAEPVGARVTAIDPFPRPSLLELDARHDALTVVRDRSLVALAALPPADVVVIDGDHNYHTVSAELRLIAERAAGPLPLLFFHDVSWPHGRRDHYFEIDRIPAEGRHATATAADTIVPGEPGLRSGGGFPAEGSAAHEGGEGNGVLTAVEDFVAAQGHLRLVVVPAFYGLGVVFDPSAAQAAALAELLNGLDRHPLLERLEANRVHQVALRWAARDQVAALEGRRARQERVLQRILESRAFVVAEKLAALSARSGRASAPGISRAEIRDALGE